MEKKEEEKKDREERRARLRKKRQKEVRMQISVLATVGILIVVGIFVFSKQRLGDTSEITREDSDLVGQAAETEAETAAPVTTQLEIMALGDNLLHMPVVNSGYQEDGSLNYDSIFEGVFSEIAAADIAVINQETILGGESLEYSGFPLFNSPQEMGDTLARIGFNVVLHATNHTMDKGYNGVANTMDFWRSAHPEVTVLGINQTEAEQEEITILEINGIKAAVLNYTYGTNDIPLPDDMPYLVNLMEEEMVTRHLTKARKEADVVIVFAHWGTEYSHQKDEYQEEWTQLFADQGVDVVIGSHPHAVQPVEWIDRENGDPMLVYYSLGNAVHRQDMAAPMLGGMARVTIEKTGDEISIVNGGVTPIINHFNWDSTVFKMYKLSNYTEEMAQEHGLQNWDSNFSYSMINELAEEVFGEFIQWD